MTLRRAVLIICGALFLAGMPALQFWIFPAPFSGWFILIVLGLPVWFYLEWLGEKVLGAPFFKKMSSTARIAIGVPVIIALGALALVLVGLVRHLAGSA